MMVAASPQLIAARFEVARHMDAIAKLFAPGAKVTVLVRSPEDEREPGARDFIMTNDTLGEVRALVARRTVAEAEVSN